MLRVILNRLKAKAEELLAEDQADFRRGRRTVEQIFISRVIIHREKPVTPTRFAPQLHRLQEGV